jgi:hypothetical protein
MNSGLLDQINIENGKNNETLQICKEKGKFLNNAWGLTNRKTGNGSFSSNDRHPLWFSLNLKNDWEACTRSHSKQRNS